MIERFAVAELTTPSASFAEDLDEYVEAEVGGIGIREQKLPRGTDGASLQAFCWSGLRATLAVPEVWSVLPSDLAPGPSEPAERVAAMCASVRRLAAFDPAAIGVHLGPRGSLDQATARATVVAAVQQLARTAATLHPRGFTIGVEPMHPELGPPGWEALSLTDAVELLDAVGEPNVKLVLDIRHLPEEELAEAVQFVDRVAVVQLGGAAGSSLGSPIVRRLVRMIEDAGYRGWYELELCAHDRPGTPVDADKRDSAHRIEFLRAARTEFRTIYEERQTSTA